MSENTSWQLEEFVDSLVVELDKTRETLAVKAINKPLSYTVKEVALDLHIFPSYDGDQVTFVTAQPGQEGASKVTIQLGSITDQQVRATSKLPGQRNEVSLDAIDVDKRTRRKLRKLGVNSAEDLKQLEQRNVDVAKVSDEQIDYRKLAGEIEKSRRSQNPPLVHSAELSADDSGAQCLWIRGENLAIEPRFLPVAVINQELADVLSYDAGQLRIRIAGGVQLADDNEVILTVDPFAVVKFNVRALSEVT